MWVFTLLGLDWLNAVPCLVSQTRNPIEVPPATAIATRDAPGWDTGDWDGRSHHVPPVWHYVFRRRTFVALALRNGINIAAGH